MKNVNKTLLIVGALGFGSVANAAVYHLTDSNALPDGEYYASVTIVEEGEDIRFTIDPNELLFEGLYNGVDDNFGLQAFSFNYDVREMLYDGNDVLIGYGDDLAGDVSIGSFDPADWNVTNTNGSISEFGKFDFDLAGDGASRANPLTFLITGVDGDTLDNYNIYFAGHIADFTATDCPDGETVEQCTSAWFAGGLGGDRGLDPPAVPIPASVWLMGSGLLGLVGVARREPKV